MDIEMETINKKIATAFLNAIANDKENETHTQIEIFLPLKVNGVWLCQITQIIEKEFPQMMLEEEQEYQKRLAEKLSTYLSMLIYQQMIANINRFVKEGEKP